jgi:hypothetical protein
VSASAASTVSYSMHTTLSLLCVMRHAAFDTVLCSYALACVVAVSVVVSAERVQYVLSTVCDDVSSRCCAVYTVQLCIKHIVAPPC